MKKNKNAWIYEIFKNNENLQFILTMIGIMGVCYLIAFIITHLFGIQHIKVHTPIHGDISMTTGIFFMVVFIPLMWIAKLFDDDNY